jgi:hypothetical protein
VMKSRGVLTRGIDEVSPRKSMLPIGEHGV